MIGGGGAGARDVGGRADGDRLIVAAGEDVRTAVGDTDGDDGLDGADPVGEAEAEPAARAGGSADGAQPPAARASATRTAENRMGGR